MSMRTRNRRFGVWVALCGLLAFTSTFSGCAWLRGPRVEAEPEARSPQAEELDGDDFFGIDPEPALDLPETFADSLMDLPPEPISLPVEELPEPSLTPIPVPEPPAPALADSSQTSVDPDASEVRVDIDNEERSNLLAQISSDRAIARAAIESAQTLESDDATREMIETLEQYILLVDSALEARDLRGASSLALKARLLAEQIKSN